MKTNEPSLTWDELANEYDKVHTGRKARTLPMKTIFNWAAKQTDKFVVSPAGFIFRIAKDEE